MTVTEILLQLRQETNEKGNQLIDELIKELKLHLDKIDNTLKKNDKPFWEDESRWITKKV